MPAPAPATVPALSLLELLGVLVAKAVDQQRDAVAFEEGSTPEHLLDAEGAPLCDVDAPEERAEVLWGLLRGGAADDAEGEEEDEDHADEARLADAWELAAAEGFEELYEGLDEEP